MDLANLKNLDVKDLIDKLKSGGFGDKKLLIKFGIGSGAVLIFLIIYLPYSLLIWSNPLEPTAIILRFFPSFKIFLKLLFANLQIFELKPPHKPLSAVNTTHK